MSSLFVEPPLEDWRPLHYTKPLSPRATTRGDDVIDVAEAFLTATRGMREGQVICFAEWQKWLLRAMYEELPDGRLRYRTIVVGLPRKNGKTQIVAGSAILERLIFGGSGTEIASLGAVLKNAEDLYEFIGGQIEASPFLSKIIKVKADEMRNHQKAKYEIFAADKSSRIQGQSKYLLTVDELHEFTTPKQIGAYDTAAAGQGDRPESMLIITSTAGENLESKLGDLYRTGIKASQGLVSDPSIGFFWWGAEADDDPTEPATWHKANPNLAEGLLSEEFIRGQLVEAEAAGKLNYFLRYYLNIWSRTTGTEYISPTHWERAKREGADFQPGEPIAVGFDGSFDNDSTAFIGVGLDSGVIKVLAAWHKDVTDPNWEVPRDEVLEAKNRIFRDYDVRLLYADTAYWKTEIAAWAQEHRGLVQDLKQSPARLASIYADFKKEIIGGVLTHDGDSKLSEHVQNAVMKSSGVIGKEAPKSEKKIDLGVAAAFAAAGRRIAIEKREKEKAKVTGFRF